MICWKRAHARSALVSDWNSTKNILPLQCGHDRRHRWIRGDWQITHWLLPRVPGSDARRIANPLSVLSQWKILDNLRRSLFPWACCFFMLGGGCSCPIFAVWNSAGFLEYHSPGLLSAVVDVFSTTG